MERAADALAPREACLHPVPGDHRLGCRATLCRGRLLLAVALVAREPGHDSCAFCPPPDGRPQSSIQGRSCHRHASRPEPVAIAGLPDSSAPLARRLVRLAGLRHLTSQTSCAAPIAVRGSPGNARTAPQAERTLAPCSPRVTRDRPPPCGAPARASATGVADAATRARLLGRPITGAIEADRSAPAPRHLGRRPPAWVSQQGRSTTATASMSARTLRPAATGVSVHGGSSIGS